MVEPRPPKKSESLEVRLPHDLKAAFMDQCRQEGRTASETVRRLIDGELAAASAPPPPPRRPRLRWLQVAGAALAGMAVGGVAAPSLAHSAARAAAQAPAACAPAPHAAPR